MTTTEDIAYTMDADGNGAMDWKEVTKCVTLELQGGIYGAVSNMDKFDVFKPPVDVVKV